jgi:phosphate starvation-inducible PhoH-like protein
LVLEQLFAHQGKYNALPLNMIENILDGHAEERSGHFTSGDGVLVFGPGGNKVVARTANQKRMVEACDKDDMIFAIGLPVREKHTRPLRLPFEH